MDADMNAMDAPTVAAMTQITDYDEIGDVLRSDAFVIGAYQTSRQSVARDTVMVLDGPAHIRRRTLLSPLFNDKAVAAYRDIHLLPVVDRCVQEIRAMPRQADGSIHADLVVIAQRCLYRVAAAIAGIDGVEDAAAADRLIQQIVAMRDGLVADWWQGDPNIVIRLGQEALEAFRSEFYVRSFERRTQLVAEAKASGGVTPPPDVLSTVLLHREKAWQGDDDMPLRETALFIVGASQTTAHALITLIVNLDDWLIRHPEDRRLIEEDPEFLRRCAFEALRMVVASPARIRTATCDVALASGRKINRGETVALWFIPANQNSTYFGDHGNEFDPWRHVEGVAPWGLAFGGGVHLCPGRPLVTGSRSSTGKTSVDGSMVSVARGLYALGVERDPDNPPEIDTSTHYPIFTRVPVRFTRP